MLGKMTTARACAACSYFVVRTMSLRKWLSKRVSPPSDQKAMRDAADTNEVVMPEAEELCTKVERQYGANGNTTIKKSSRR